MVNNPKRDIYKVELEPENIICNTVARNDRVICSVSSTINIDVLANDTYFSPINAGLLTIMTYPTKGTAELLYLGSITYTNTDGLEGDDSFQYRINDINGCTSIATVMISVSNIPVDYQPVDGNIYFNLNGNEVCNLATAPLQIYSDTGLFSNANSIALSLDGTVSANDGWYSDGIFKRYWSGGGFITTEPCIT